MDTLCVPVLPQLKKYRKLAITRMAKTYAQAVKTLVLSAELESTSIHISEEESPLAMRITCNSWWRRLWTLREAVLTRNLFFQLQDGAVGIEDLIAKLGQISRSPSRFKPIAPRGARTIKSSRVNEDKRCKRACK